MKTNKLYLLKTFVLVIFIYLVCVVIVKEHEALIDQKEEVYQEEHMKLQEEIKKLHNDLKQMENDYSELDSKYISYKEEKEEKEEVYKEEKEKVIEQYESLMSNEGVTEYTREEIMLLAKCVQAEAGNHVNHSKSQRMITAVILNRVNSPDFPNTIREVIYEGIQFSVAHNGALEKQVVTPETLNNVYEVVLFGSDLPYEVQYFYASNLKKDNWVKTLEIYDNVEGTTFAYNRRK